MRCRNLVTVALAAIVVTVLVVRDGYAADTDKDCEVDKTCDKTTGFIRYEVSGNDNGPALKEIVVIEVPPQNVTAGTAVGTTTVVAVKATAGAPKSTADTTGKTTAVTARTSVTVGITTNSTGGLVNTTAGTTNGTITSTTTETVGMTLTNNGVVAGILHFVPHKYCYCDLTYGGCDINCCCDADCASYDFKTFTLCADQVQSNLIKPESILFDSSLFYVVVDNVPSDYFYPERAAIQTESQVTTSLRNRDVFSWHDTDKKQRLRPDHSVSPRVEPVYNNYDLTYKSVRWMYTVNSNANTSEIITFSLKNSAFNSICAVEQPVEYLRPKETHCQTFIINLTDVCNSNSSLGYKRYYGETGLFKVVQPIYLGVNKTEKIGLTTIRATAHHHCVTVDGSPYDCRVPKTGIDDGADRSRHPVYSAGVCRRVVEAVEYNVTHNGTGGVRAVDVRFYHRDVLDTGRPVYLSQKFGVRFVRANQSAAGPPYRRSGKPGYGVGNPVLVTAAGDVGDLTNRSRHRPEPFGLPWPSVRGTCDANSAGPSRRQPVNFLENVSVRCRVPVRRRRWSNGPEESTAAHYRPTDFCKSIQNETISALGEYKGTLVASLGDPEVAKWIPVLVVKPSRSTSPPDDSSCPSIINGMHVRVLYSHVGTFDSPRATVLGMLVNYTVSTVAVDFGQAGASADVPIRASVVFVDLTRPPVRTFAEPPTYEFRLPEDFYYPFWSSDNARATAAIGHNAAASGPTFGGLRSPTRFSTVLLVNSYLWRTLL